MSSKSAGPAVARHAWATRASLLVAGLVAASTALAGGPLLTANASSAGEFVAAMNAERSAHGLAPYAISYAAEAVAQGWADHLAATGSLAHNPGLDSQLPDWMADGENVGLGPSEPAIQAAFMASPEHRANILDSDFTEVGVATAVGHDGTLYVVEDFLEPMHAAPAPKPAPRPVVTHRASSHATTTRVRHTSTDIQPSAAGQASRPVAAPAEPRHRPAPVATVRPVRVRPGHADPLAQAVAFARTMATVRVSASR